MDAELERASCSKWKGEGLSSCILHKLYLLCSEQHVERVPLSGNSGCYVCNDFGSISSLLT